MKMKTILALVMGISLGLLPLAAPVQAEQLHVPNQYPNIQAAIDVAIDGDTVIVADGTYTGDGNLNLDLLGKAITVKSETGPENCIIDCRGGRHGFWIHRGEDANSVFDGFTISGVHNNRSTSLIHCAESSPTITNCIITGDSSRHVGAIACYQSSPIITNCTITDNYGRNGGGISCLDGSPTITNCRLTGNSAHFGGAISCTGGSATISDCTITGNSAWLGGGGIHLWNGRHTISDCTIADNSSSDGDGGGIYCGASGSTIRNCIITGNKSRYTGGGICCEYGTAISNCTLTGNSAKYYGGGLSTYISGTTVTNCILWNNTSLDGADEFAEVSGTLLNYNCIRSWTPDQQGTGNIGENPRFVDPGLWDPNGTPDDTNDDFWVDGHYHLSEDSPCIDTGDPNYVPEPNETDLDGNPRIIGDYVDMGAYEFAPAVQVEVEIQPQTLNLTANGRWLTCRIRLPEDYDIADIDPNSVLLEYEIGPDQLELAGQSALAKFSRSDLQEILEPGEVELILTGQLSDGTFFEGSDTIKVIAKDGKNK